MNRGRPAGLPVFVIVWFAATLLGMRMANADSYLDFNNPDRVSSRTPPGPEQWLLESKELARANENPEESDLPPPDPELFATLSGGNLSVTPSCSLESMFKNSPVLLFLMASAFPVYGICDQIMTSRLTEEARDRAACFEGARQAGILPKRGAAAEDMASLTEVLQRLEGRTRDQKYRLPASSERAEKIRLRVTHLCLSGGLSTSLKKEYRTTVHTVYIRLVELGQQYRVSSND